MLRKLTLTLLAFATMFLAATPPAGAQATTTGNLAGTVTDPSGAAIPNAKLIISDPATGSRNTQTTNSVGAYTFSDLQVGTYILSTTYPGFATTVTKDIGIETGRSINLNVALVLGAANTEVEVISGSEVLETTTNTLAATIKPDAVQDLPLNGRDASSLTQLAPGSQSAGDARYATFNALPAAAINITVDGMNSNFQKFRTSTSGNYSPSPVRLGAVEEISVSTSSLTADAGAEGSVALRYQIKRGTNKYHGSAFWQYSSSLLNANSYGNDAAGIAKTKTHTNDEGGNIGGPIWKNKVFFFSNYEQNFANGKTQVTAYALTTAAQAGNITYTDSANVVHPVNVLNAAATAGFNSTINPRIASELSQINTYNQGAVAKATPLPYQNLENWSFNTITKNVYPTERIDYQITPTLDAHIAYDLWWRSLPGSQVYAGDPTHTEFRSSYSTLTFGTDWTITPHIVNQVNLGLLNDQERYNVTASFTPYAAINNILYASPTFTNGGSVAAPTLYTAALPEPRNNPVRDVFDNVTWNKGKHTFTFGGDLRNSTAHDLSISNPPVSTLGISTTDPANTGLFNQANFPGLITSGSSTPDLNNLKSLYATLTGRVSSIAGSNAYDTASGNYKVLGDLVIKEAQTVGGFYFQDSWRPTSHLAFNYGMRYQFSGTTHNTNNIYTSPTIADLYGPSTGEFAPGSLGGIANPQIYLRPSTYSADLNQPAPNAGFAWNPGFDGGKMVVRGGFSISHYDEGWGDWEAASSTNPGIRQSASILPGTGTGQYTPGSITLGTIPTLNTSPATFAFPLPESNFTFTNTLSAMDPKIRSPYVESWYFGVQHKLGYNTAFEANYVGNHVIHAWQTFNINEVNIYENGFLAEFQKAQADLAKSTGGNSSFYGADLPILNQAFGGAAGAGFKNSTFINYVQSGQAGALANAIATNSTYFCNLVGGGTFAPCTKLGYVGATAYPINFFQANPYSSGTARLTSDPGSSQYNGLQTQIKHPPGHGLTLQVNYTYSHAFSTRYTTTSDSGTVDFITLRNLRLNRNPAPSDIRNALKAYAVYTLPFSGHSYFMKQVLNNWTVSPILTWQSGRNFKLTGGTATVNTSDSGLVLTGINAKQLQKSVGYYPGPSVSTPLLLLNPAVLTKTNGVAQVASESTPGVIGQQVFLTAPQFVNTDFSVSKILPVTEWVKLNFQAEMLNVFNHPSFTYGPGSPGNSAAINTSPAVIASTSPGTSPASRAFQFRLGLVF
ncbi:TonB-dependent receptor [Granulicella tundricola]|uniref:TonB-dependent transporter Oar-like beta-barrel domain-containing protein n=1 Tax=Granulicella tundricola (strain ATCC BAA-1859 / DSM 23138 / MP5ACTX9) TaxID=1198114 RepID=E8X6D1_GRATM|nr:carboxypeptidase-like regulatory domain-containing protein [Granulicella tundricola]ADW71015.1 hypothetical protein AciX9_4239 [Granulicella tundricola MP5ACTX9]